MAALTLVLGVGTGGWAALHNLNSVISAYDSDALVTNRPTRRAPTEKALNARDPFGGHAVNLLIIGSDSRGGANAKISKTKVTGMRSDVTMIAHISANRKRVQLVAIPRDTLVDIPACKLSNGHQTAPTYGKFNSAFAAGADAGANIGDAAACAQQTVESLTDVLIDGYIVVDFAGFVDMVDALGKVEVCVDHDMSSTAAGLDVKAGCQNFDGKTALAYARARKGPGMPEGSDLARITRQQQLLAAIVRKATSSSLLTDLPDLFRFVQATIRAMTVSSELDSVQHLAGLAFALRGTSLDKIQFATAPYVDAGDGANVVLAAGAAELWDSLAEDRPLAGATPTPAGSPKASKSPKASPSASPSATPRTSSTASRPAATSPTPSRRASASPTASRPASASPTASRPTATSPTASRSASASPTAQVRRSP
jgi:LCP family protein required for cell wall assembly